MAQLTANDQGVIKGRFTIPPNVPAGSKSVTFTGSGGARGEAVFVGQGNLTTQTLRQVTNVTQWYYDPLAQTFALEKAVQLAGVDLWFTAKNTEVRVQIREVVSGVPSRTIIAEKILAPDDIVVTGGGHTRVLFPRWMRARSTRWSSSAMTRIRGWPLRKWASSTVRASSG